MRGLAVAVLSMLMLAAPAAADVSLDEFSVTPANTTAGGHPTVTIVQRMSYTTRADDLKDSFVRLAPGLLGYPQNADFCGPEQFAADGCPHDSRVGTVSAHATLFVPLLPSLLPGLPIVVPGAIYNLPPEGNEPARIGLVLRPATAPLIGEKVFLEAPTVPRPGPDGYGLESVFSGQPRTFAGQNVQIDEVTLTFNGQGSNGPLMRMPSACGQASSVGRASSYDSTVISENASAFTPTNCDALGFNPRVSGSVGAPGLTDRRDSPPLTSTIHFDPEEAALKRAAVTIPPFLQPNPEALGRTCAPGQADATACPESSRVGTAIIDSPLQARPVRGPIYLAVNSPAPLPGLIVVLPDPVGVRLDATVESGSFGTRNVFASNPDLPVRSFTLEFNGGPGGVLTASRDLCDPKTDAKLHVDLLSHSGKRRQSEVPLATPGCDPRASASIRRRGGRATLLARLTAASQGPSITSASLRLPKTLRRGTRAPLVYVGRRRMRAVHRRRSLTLPFAGDGVRGAVVVWRGLRASRKLRSSTRIAVTLTDTRGKRTKLRPEALVRGGRPRRRG